MSSRRSLRRRLAAAAATVVLPGVLVLGAATAGHGDDVPPPPPPPDEPQTSTDGTEAWEKGRPPTVRVYLDKAANVPVSVVLDTADGTAVAPKDYTAIKGLVVTVPAGKLSVEVPLEIVADSVTEPDESFTITISKPSSGKIGKGTATVVIKDGAGPPTQQ